MELYSPPAVEAEASSAEDMLSRRSVIGPCFSRGFPRPSTRSGLEELRERRMGRHGSRLENPP